MVSIPFAKNGILCDLRPFRLQTNHLVSIWMGKKEKNLLFAWQSERGLNDFTSQLERGLKRCCVGDWSRWGFRMTSESFVCFCFVFVFFFLHLKRTQSMVLSSQASGAREEQGEHEAEGLLLPVRSSAWSRSARIPPSLSAGRRSPQNCLLGATDRERS